MARIAIHTGSSRSDKNVDVETFKTVGALLQLDGHDVIYVGMGKEYATVGTPRVKDLVKELKKCDLFIGNDSGVAQVADNLGLQSVIVYGPTSIVKNKPRNDRSLVITKGLNCAPCYSFGKIKCTNSYPYFCLEIGPTDILSKVRLILGDSVNL